MLGSVVLLKDLCMGHVIEVQLVMFEYLYCSFEVSIPPAAMVTLLLVLIGAPVVFKISYRPPELDRTKLVLLPPPTVY